jgi:hypothetical protein
MYPSRRKRDHDGFLQHLLRFSGPTHLAERCGEYTVEGGTIGV